MGSDIAGGAREALAALGDTKTVRLQTRKRDGTWVPSPVSVVIEGEHAYFRTYDASGKYKRLRNFPEVRMAPSTLRGTPTGPVIEGRARKLDGAEDAHVRSLLETRFPVLHGKLVPWMHRRKAWTTVHYEVTFAS